MARFLPIGPMVPSGPPATGNVIQYRQCHVGSSDAKPAPPPTKPGSLKTVDPLKD